MLTDTASKAGNLLLNVGPRSDGTIPAESAKILREAGDWLRKNGESS
jgi:alpha-L-fucosidase